MIPVYMINGFLESGKTEFIKYTIAQPYFQSRGTTLLILCEEGEVEYEAKLLKKSRTVVELIEDEDIRNSEIAFPNLADYNNLETFKYLGEEGDSLYNDYWKEVKSE